MANINYNQFHVFMLGYVEQALNAVKPNSHEAKEFLEGLIGSKKVIGLSLPNNFPIYEPTKKRKNENSETSVHEDDVWTADIRAKRYKRVLDAVKVSRANIEVSGTKSLRFFINLKFFQAQAKLDETDAQLLTLLCGNEKRKVFRPLISSHTRLC